MVLYCNWTMPRSSGQHFGRQAAVSCEENGAVPESTLLWKNCVCTGYSVLRTYSVVQHAWNWLTHGPSRLKLQVSWKHGETSNITGHQDVHVSESASPSFY